MTPRRVIAALLTVCAVVLSACTGSATSTNGDYVFHGAQSIGSLIPIADRKPAANFTGSLLSGGTYKLTDYAGKITVVNFWGAWCGPCKVETPQFGLVYNAYKAKAVTFVGIDVKEPDRSEPKKFVKDHAVPYPIVYDQPGATAVRLGNVPATGVPFSIILDRHHRVAAVYITTLAPKDIEPVLNKLLAEK